MIHLKADVATLTTAKEFREIEKPRSDFLRVLKLDRKLDNLSSHSPDAWFRELDETIVQWNKEFIAQNGAIWNSKSNCQQFARFMTTKLGLNYPSAVSVGGDVMPDVIDWVFYGMSIAQNMS